MGPRFGTQEEDAVATMTNKKMGRCMSGAFGHSAIRSDKHLSPMTGSAWHLGLPSKSFTRELFSGFFSDSIAFKDASVSPQRPSIEAREEGQSGLL
jgi:hypothetical protein